jgi:hypothetical protein
MCGMVLQSDSSGKYTTGQNLCRLSGFSGTCSVAGEYEIEKKISTIF